MDQSIKTRLDVKIVEANKDSPHPISRQKAIELIKTSLVSVDDQIITKPSYLITSNQEIQISFDGYVSRGARKLLHALELSGIGLIDKVCLDIGASTGGFTQICLERGAKQVFAVDVGTNQLHPKLRQDPRVTVMEQTHIKDLLLPTLVDFCCVDVSFISLTKVIPHLKKHLKQGSTGIFLVKPQFEVGRERLPIDGVVKDPELHSQSIYQVVVAAETQGFRVEGKTASPITGKMGNQEFLLQLTLVRKG